MAGVPALQIGWVCECGAVLGDSLECEQCGEKYYTDAVAEKIERIVDSAKKLMQEISVVDFSSAA